MTVSPASHRGYTIAKCILESEEAFNLYRNGVTLEEIGKRYGLSSEGARSRIRKIEESYRDGTLNEKIRKAKETLGMHDSEPEPVLVHIVKEHLPVRSISGARFSPLY